MYNVHCTNIVSRVNGVSLLVRMKKIGQRVNLSGLQNVIDLSSVLVG